MTEYCLFYVEVWPLCMTKAEWSAWVQAVGSVAAVCAAFLIPLWLERRADYKRYRGHLLTIATDVRIAERQARVYIQSPFLVPAYRLPLHGMRDALPAVLASGTLSTFHAASLVQWYVDATSFNYSLDLAQQLKHAEKDFRKESSRTRVKANHLVKGGKLSRFDGAIQALRKAGALETDLQQISLNLSDDDPD